MKNVLIVLIVFVLSFTSVFAQVAGSGLKTDVYQESFIIPDQNYLDFSGSFTVEIWVKFDLVANSQLDDACIVHKEDWDNETGWLFEFNNFFGYLTFRINGGEFTKRVECSYSSIFDDLEWHHIAASYSSSTKDLILVVDGMQKDSENLSTTTIGANTLDVSVSSSFYGQVDNLRIWNSYRNETTIRDNMFIKLENPAAESNLIGCYRLDENGGTNCNDESASNNDGTTNGAVEWITSHAVIAHKSHTGRGYYGVATADLVENSNVSVDIEWYGGDPSSHPSIEASFAALQINQAPTVTTGLPTYYASQFWDTWMRFAQAPWSEHLRFHYDNIGGISDETDLKFYYRSQSGDAWTEVSSYTIVSNDGGSSTTTDGIGYIETDLTNLLEYQYIIGSETQTLPVVLSTFTAQYINDTPTLCWSTQSETNNAGWNIYRSETEEFEAAIQINTELIPGAGTTSEPTDYIYEDENEVNFNTEYWYWLESVDYSGETGSYGPITLLIPEDENEPGSPEIPGIYGLHQNYPNPFNPSTEISFMLKENCIAELSVYNIKGEKITTLFQNKSVAKDELIRTNWNGKDDFGKAVSSGIYLYKLRTNKENFVRKMILLK